MTSRPKADRRTDSRWLPAVLASLASYFTIGVFFGRPESIGELWFLRAAPSILVGTLWGSVVYFRTRCETEGRRNGRVSARWATVVTWAGVAIPLHLWHYNQGLFNPYPPPAATEMPFPAAPNREKPAVLGGGYGSVRGFVVDPDRKPIAGAQLFFSDHLQDKFATTDKRGAFEFDPIAQGNTFTLRIYRDGYHPWGGSPHTGEGLTIVLEPNAATPK
jgi:hypothetical protein